MRVQLDAPFRRRFGERLRRLRERRGWTQEKLADELGCEQRVISRYERGLSLPQAAMLVGLASAFDVSIGKLLLGQEDDERARAAAGIRDRELLDRFRELETLGPDDRRVVIRVIDAFLAEHACDHVVMRGKRNVPG